MSKQQNSQEIKIDPANIIFAKAMEVTTYIGILIMLIFGLLYLFNINSFVPMKDAVAFWNHPVSVFWHYTCNIRVHGYGWFLNNLSCMDCISMVGISILALAPFVGIVASWPKVGATHRILTLLYFVLVAEYLFAIFKPIILPGLGGH
ncbi:hypothetical protein [Thermodesulfatator atlanticus]